MNGRKNMKIQKNYSQYFNTIVFLMTLVFFISCGSGSNADNTIVLSSELERDTLQGIDSDNDGIRDDIQDYLITTYTNNPKHQTAFQNLAKVEQKKVFSFLMNRGK